MEKLSVSTEWAFRGIEATILENKELRVVILHGKGADISEIQYKPYNLNLLFRNPWGPRRLDEPCPSPVEGQAFRYYTGGGLSDILPNAGEPCIFLGTRFGLHDETPLLKWSVKNLEKSDEMVSALFAAELTKYPFSVEKKISLDRYNRIVIEESIKNDSKNRLPYSWLIHPTFSNTFANEYATLNMEAKKISKIGEKEKWDFPTFLDDDGTIRNFNELPSSNSIVDSTLVVSGLKEGRYVIQNLHLGLSFELSWDKERFPYLWYYRSINSPRYPYFGRSSFIALEPCTSRFSGLAKQVEEGDAPYIDLGKEVKSTITATVTNIRSANY